MTRVEEVDRSPAVDAARGLFREYAAALGFSLDFQGFEAELARLPGEYAPPTGALLLAHEGDRLAGCVALRDLGGGTCEMKRLFVRPDFRGRGIGRLLVEAIIEQGRRREYHRMRLDTVGTMTEALELYRTVGFRAIPAYRHNPRADARYLELLL